MTQHNESMVVIETEEAQRKRHAAAIEARNQGPLDQALRPGGVFLDAAHRHVDAHGHPLPDEAVAAYQAALAEREATVAQAMRGPAAAVVAPAAPAAGAGTSDDAKGAGTSDDANGAATDAKAAGKGAAKAGDKAKG